MDLKNHVCIYTQLTKEMYFNKLLDLTLRNHIINNILNEFFKNTFNNGMFCIRAKIPI